MYQLGLLLRELLFGASVEERGDGTPLQDALAALCADCLQPQPSARPANAVAVAARLEVAAHARALGRWARTWRRLRRVGRTPATRWVVAALAFAAIGAGAGRVALRPRVCGAGPARVAAVWGPANKEAMRRTFLASGKATAAAAFENVSKLLDAYLGRWLAAYADACEATQVRGEQSAEALDLRMTCLSDDLESVGAVTRVLSAASPAVVDRSVQTASALDDPSRCGDVAHLRSSPQLPADPILRKSAQDLRRRLLEAGALRDSEQCEKATPIADAVIAESERISYCPTRAEALVLKGTCAYGDFRRSTALTEESFFSAEGCGYERAAAMASSQLVYLEGQNNPMRAEQWGRLSWELLKRIGGDRQIEGWLLNNLGVLRLFQGRFEEGRQLTERSIAVKSSWMGPDALDVTNSEWNLALLSSKLGQTQEALETIRRLEARYERLLGRDHYDFAIALSGEGELLRQLGQLEPARERFDRALRILASNAIDDDRIVTALVGLGQIATDTGDPSTARSLLERALEVHLAM